MKLLGLSVTWFPFTTGHDVFKACPDELLLTLWLKTSQISNVYDKPVSFQCVRFVFTACWELVRWVQSASRQD